MFLLPKKVLKKVESACRSLWKGIAGSSYGAKVKWDIICRPKEDGGLGLKHLGDWNKACLARLVWMIFTGKDTLWIAWMKNFLLKCRCLWTIRLAASSS